VAAASALIVLEAGYNVALMAPTEILAAQHHQTFSRWFAPLGIDVRLHTGSHKLAARNQIPSPKTDTTVDSPAAAPNSVLVIGTHALTESTFSLPNLGLVIIDEQHIRVFSARSWFARPLSTLAGNDRDAYPTHTRADSLWRPGHFSDRRIATRTRPDQDICSHCRQTAEVWDFVRQKLGEGRQFMWCILAWTIWARAI